MTRPPVVVHLNPAPLRSANTTSKPPSEWLPKERREPMPKGKPNPLALAQHWLGTRLRERVMQDGSLGSFLDGTPADLNRIMRETNLALKAAGEPQITANPRWQV